MWEKNLQRIQQHNLEESQGQHAFRLAMNHYGDLVPADAPGTFPGDPSMHPGLDLGTGDPWMHPSLDLGIGHPQPARWGAVAPGAGLLARG